MEKKFGEITRPLLILFVIVNALLLVFTSRLAAKGIDTEVPIVGNIILFGVALLNVYFQIRNLKNPNPQAVIRGVMAGTFIKLFLLAAAVIIYLLAAGASRNVNGVFVTMGLYIIYTWIETKISLRLNSKK
jgi:hypothetical protein